MASQWPIDVKVARADHVVRTDGTIEDTDRQVADLHGRLSAGGTGP
jgi:dephospho-CoA kinase